MNTQDSTINEQAQPAPQEGQKPLSVADAMRQTMAEMKEREEKEERKAAKAEQAKQAKPQVEKQAKPEPVKQAEKTAEKREPENEEENESRDVKSEGKTNKEAKNDNDDKDADEVKEEKSDVEVKAEKKTEGEKRTIRAPSSWSAKAKDSFYDLPEHIQAEVLKREEDFHGGIKQYKERADYADRLQRVIMPYEAQLRASGQTPEQVVQTMLDASYRLSQGTPQQKAQYLFQIAQESGADLQSLIKYGNNTETTGNYASTEQNSYIAQLEQRLRQLEGYTTQQATLSQQQQEQQIYSSINQFKNETDEAGRPKHPFFEDVEQDMAAIITIARQNGRPTPTLSQAYEQAVWANPQTREALLLRQQKEAQAKLEAERNRKAEEAARKTQYNTSRSSGVQFAQGAPLGDMRQTMRAVLNDISARK